MAATTQANTQNEVPWLKELLQLQPGSPWGNVEMRGLDSDFARETYVETELDRQVADAIRGKSVNLVILCGNAGDGKTAFLQNLAANLGFPPVHSAERVWEHDFPGGPSLKVNLDGAAAYKGEPADAILDRFLGPFRDGPGSGEHVHCVAINDGPLLAWLEQQEDTWLKNQLRTRLLAEDSPADSRIRFIDLNARSLAGGYRPDSGRMN